MIRGTEFGHRFEGVAFNTFEASDDNRAALNACQRMAKRESGGVVLIGPVGTGKTHLLVSTAREFSSDIKREWVEEKNGFREVGEQRDVEFWPILDLAAALRKEGASDDAGKLTDRCMKCALLILDDLGREKHSDFLLQELQRIIDYRYREMLPMMVATNLEIAKLVERYGEHSMSRWVHQCDVVRIGGDDYRNRRA